MFSPLQLVDGAEGPVVELLDQRRLPAEEVWLRCEDVETVAEAIETLAVRGAPAIGCTAALALAMVAAHSGAESRRAVLRAAHERLARTRPTAVNLFEALEAMGEVIAATSDEALVSTLRAAAERYVEADRAACVAMGQHALPWVKHGACIMTHCNAGALATAGYGTALGVIRAAHEAGREVRVLANETRPLLQGARLTAWELHRDGIPVEVIADSMAGALMAAGEVDLVVVGADRIARNGDVANKIGTYSLAVLAHHHRIPFYVAAPTTTFDPDTPDGASIPIEARGADEVACHGGARKVPVGVGVRNPAFDVTPAELVTGIVTERGRHRASELATDLA